MAGIPRRTPWPRGAGPRRFPRLLHPPRDRGVDLQNTFPTPGPKRFLTTVPFFNWHKVLLGILALSECEALGPKTRRSCGVGRRREVFVYNLHHRHCALLINRASLRRLPAGVTFFSSNFSFLSLREEHMEKFVRKLK